MGRRALPSLALAALLVLAVSASASARVGFVTISPAAGPAGTSVSISASGFPARRKASIRLGRFSAERLRVSRSGRFATTLVVPSDARGVLSLVSRTRGREVLNRFSVTDGGAQVGEVASSRGQRVRWTVGINGIRIQGKGFARRARLRIAWLGRTHVLRTNRRGRFSTSLPLATAGSHVAIVRLGSLRLRFTLVGTDGAGSPVGGAGVPPPPPVNPGVVTPPPPGASPQAPQKTAGPTVSGASTVGQYVAVDPGAWTGTLPVSFSYQWQRCSSSGSNCGAITGATGQSYLIAAGDQGSRLRAVVTASNPVGASSATSDLTGVVAAAPTNTVLPKITGTAREGQTLTASKGTWSGTTPITYAYQWQRCNSSGAACGQIPGATASTYPVTAVDIGSTLRVAVTATNSGGVSVVTSGATAVVQAAPPPGVAASWHMDETSGSTMFDSAGGHNGTLHNVQLGQPGASGLAYGFTGSSWVDVRSGSGLNPGAQDITIEIRMKATALPPPEDWDLIRKGVYDTVGGEYKVEYYPDGQALCGFKGANGYAEVKGGPALDNNAWHTVACVKTSSQIRLVVDGNPVASKPASLGAIDNTEPVVIGSHAGSSEFFQGLLDEAKITLA